MISINSLTVLVTSETMNCLFGATIGFQNLSMFISYDLDASFYHILATFMIVALCETTANKKNSMVLQYHI